MAGRQFTERKTAAGLKQTLIYSIYSRAWGAEGRNGGSQRGNRHGWLWGVAVGSAGLLGGEAGAQPWCLALPCAGLHPTPRSPGASECLSQAAIGSARLRSGRQGVVPWWGASGTELLHSPQQVKGRRMTTWTTGQSSWLAGPSVQPVGQEGEEWKAPGKLPREGGASPGGGAGEPSHPLWLVGWPEALTARGC